MIFNSEKDIEEELKLKLIMIEHSMDDPLLELKLIDLLYQTYKKYNIRVPGKIEQFLNKEKGRIAPLVQEIIEKKKQELDSLLEKKNKQVFEQRKKEEEEKQKEKEKQLTRTQLIFGELNL